MVGRVFMGRYEAIRILGEGGMGRVYLAHQPDLDRQVVVKVMHEHIAIDPRFRDRFKRETKIMARFQHPFAVTLYDASLNDPEGPCIVMEYIKGLSLDTVLTNNGGRLDPVRVGRILRQLCEVLQAAHAVDIIHRDLKPANLMLVDSDTQYELLKVMDFGLAKLLSGEAFNNVTAPNTEFAVGTPGYMCPEQARGEPMDHRGDLYSVGVILYELLTGHLPFAGRSTMDVLLAHATESPPPFTALEASLRIPPAIERVVPSALAKDPEARPSSARVLSERYEQALVGEMGTLAESRQQPTEAVPVVPRLAPRSPSQLTSRFGRAESAGQRHRAEPDRSHPHPAAPAHRCRRHRAFARGLDAGDDRRVQAAWLHRGRRRRSAGKRAGPDQGPAGRQGLGVPAPWPKLVFLARAGSPWQPDRHGAAPAAGREPRQSAPHHRLAQAVGGRP